MATYTSGIAPQEYQPGSIEFSLSLDPTTGGTRYAPGSVEYSEIAAYMPENDRFATVTQRAEAREHRMAVEAALIESSVAEGRLPEGYVPVRHYSDSTASMSLGHAIGNGVFLVPAFQADIAQACGFVAVTWPPLP